MWLCPADGTTNSSSSSRPPDANSGPIGVAGVYGVGPAIQLNGAFAANRVGQVVDRGRILDERPKLPAKVATLDELLLVVPRDTPLRFDPNLGFHLYGADLCPQAAEQGLAVVALEAPCHHNSQTIGLPEPFFQSAEIFAHKWQHRLPVATPCVIIDETRRAWILGNSPEHHGPAEAYEVQSPEITADRRAFLPTYSADSHSTFEVSGIQK